MKINFTNVVMMMVKLSSIVLIIPFVVSIKLSKCNMKMVKMSFFSYSENLFELKRQIFKQ